MNTKVMLKQPNGNSFAMLLSKAKITLGNAILTAFLFFLTQNSHAQCSLGCNDNVQVSLDNTTCRATVTVDMIAPTARQSCPSGIFSVVIMNTNGTMLATSPVVTGADAGKKMMVKIIDTQSGNSCWGSILVEDKLAPVIVCQNDTVFCNANLNTSGVIKAPIVTDNCTNNATVTFTDVMNDLPCSNNDFTAVLTRTYTARDASGNSSTCVKQVYLRKGRLSDIVFPRHRDGVQAPALDCVNANTAPSNTGEPTINGQPVSTMCDMIVTYNDQDRNGCAGTKIILRNWIVMDFCSGVANSYIQYIKIDDKIAPTLSCPANVTISTRSTACTADYTIPTITATDNCSPASRVVITYQATSGTLNGNRLTGLPIGTTSITITATDDCNNATSCTYRVTVRDNVPPIAVCSGLKRVSLGLDGTAELGAASFDDGSVDNCGIDRFEISRMGTTVSFSTKIKFDCDDSGDTISVILRVWDSSNNFNDCMTSVIIEDKLTPILVCPPDLTMNCRADYNNLNLTGGPVVSDNCQVFVKYKDQSLLNNCGVGTIQRTWTATDKGGRKMECVQNIHLTNPTPFFINPTNPNDPNDDVTWPADFLGSTCGASLLPAVTGSPIVKTDDCDQIAVTYEDTDIPAQSGGCKHVLRKWIIVDFCQFKANVTPRPGYWEYTQNIRITNNEPPKINIDCKDITVGLDDKDCLKKFVNLVVTASDDCSDATKLNWTYKIDLNDDGFYDRLGSDGNLSGDFPFGKSLVYLSVSDGCGNIRSCTFRIHVVDTKKPSAVCHHGLSASLMQTGQTMLTAKMFDGGSSDNCTPANELILNISPSVFTCTHVGPTLVTFTVTDKAGNSDFCTTYVDIQDNMNMCPDTLGNKVAIAGAITNTANVGVEKVEIMVNGAASQIMTSNVGNFMLYKPMGQSYVVKPQKDDDPLNGVTTFDLVRMSKHILGLEPITDPYLIVAADVNRNNMVTASDIVTLRKAILGISKNLAPNQSWRFIKKDYVFPTTSPLGQSIPDSYQMLLGSPMTTDFIAVKIGDLNGSAKPSGYISSAPRGIGEALVIEIADRWLEKGKTYTIPLTIKEKDITSIQFTLQHSDALELQQIASGNLQDMDNNNFAVLDNGVITTSWNSTATTNPNDIYTTLTFKANASMLLSDALQLNSAVTLAEAYNTDEEAKQVTLQFINKDTNHPTKVSKGMELYQNQPNPFSEVTSIRFYLPESTSATISVTDITGKTVFQQRGEFSSGIHTIELSKDKFATSTGVYFYQLATPTHTMAKKMILVE
jgi:hypothetical protein